MQLFNDLHVLNTCTNTWFSPRVSGDIPSARRGHGAAVIGRRLFVHGGCSRLSRWAGSVLHSDLYVLDTDTFEWSQVFTYGPAPSHRENHTCSSWGNKLVVVGGKDWERNYQSDVHILDTDTRVWTKLNCRGEIMPPRAAHTTLALGNSLFCFGGYLRDDTIYDDLYKIELDSGVWTMLAGSGDGPSPRHGLAGDVLWSQQGGILAFFGGCNNEYVPTEDVYYFHTGLRMEDRDKGAVVDESPERKKAKKCREQGEGSTSHFLVGGHS